jgi:hypothetical protein
MSDITLSAILLQTTNYRFSLLPSCSPMPLCVRQLIRIYTMAMLRVCVSLTIILVSVSLLLEILRMYLLA